MKSIKKIAWGDAHYLWSDFRLGDDYTQYLLDEYGVIVETGGRVVWDKVFTVEVVIEVTGGGGGVTGGGDFITGGGGVTGGGVIFVIGGGGMVVDKLEEAIGEHQTELEKAFSPFHFSFKFYYDVLLIRVRRPRWGASD